MPMTFSDGLADRSDLEAALDSKGTALEKNYRAIANVLVGHGVDLDNYRRAAVLRRVRRRMYALDITSIEEYGPRLVWDTQEVLQLLRELQRPQGLLFRDPAVVAGLRRALAQVAGESACPRIWVPGCGVGEECFAAAMLATEVYGPNQSFLVFGTDPDREALRQAQAGAFPDSAVDSVPAELRERYLSTRDGVPRVAADIQRACVFLRLDPDRQSPFFDIDIIICRNLLYYMVPGLRRRILRNLNLALRPGGLLAMGEFKPGPDTENLFELSPLGYGLLSRAGRGQAAADEGSARVASLSGAHAAAVTAVSTPILLLDSDYTVIEANPAALALGLREDPVPGTKIFELVAEADQLRLFDAVRGLQSGLSVTADVALSDDRAARLRLTGLASKPAAILVEWKIHGAAAGGVDRAVEAERFAHALMRTMSEAAVLTDAGGIVTGLNAQAEKLTGWARADVLNQPYSNVFALSSYAKENADDPLKQALSGGAPETAASQFYLRHRDGRRIAVEARARRVPGGGGVLVLDDVSERNLRDEELDYRATHDQLTGLLNREEFYARVSAVHADCRNSGGKAVLCYIDVDQFKVINDTLGHAVGDEMLRELAAELRVHVEEKDTFARLGGDEFGVLLSGMGLEAAREIVEALILASRRFRFNWSNQTYAVTISVGVAEIDADTVDISTAMSMADAACFAAKDAGRDRARFVGEDLEIARQHVDMSLVGKLGRALDDERIVLFYEDVVPLDRLGQVVYRELLVRLQDNGELLSPAAFIQAAERYFLMGALDRCVLRNAFRGIAKLPEDGVIYAVNLSGQSLSDEKFLGYVFDEIESSGVAPERICFEITETAAVSRLSEAVRFITRITDIGCRFALDDFGAGMASFSYLKNFEVDFLKIDGSFVRSALSSSVDRGMVESMNRLGHQFGLRTIAEHIESPELIEPLRLIGVDWGQGRGIAPGRPFDELINPTS